MRKSAEAFRTISEVADELDVQKHVLRFWEIKFPQIKPLKRGGGRRYYRPADVELLRGIRALLHSDGFTIKGVQKILREEGIDFVKGRATGDVTAPAKRVARKSRAAAQKTDGHAATEPRGTVLSGDVQQRIHKMIAELQECRRLLSAQPLADGAPDQVRAAAS